MLHAANLTGKEDASVPGTGRKTSRAQNPSAVPPSALHIASPANPMTAGQETNQGSFPSLPGLPNGFSSNEATNTASPLDSPSSPSLQGTEREARVKQPTRGSRHQPACHSQGRATFLARNIPRRTMGAAILERTKTTASPGGVAGRRRKRRGLSRDGPVGALDDG